MKVLALETATRVCGAALVEGGAVLAAAEVDGTHVHAERILGLIDAVVRDQGGIGAIGAIAVSLGPGSFTGLRIGVSVAKGLAYGGDRVLVGVPTLEALMERARNESRILGAGEQLVALLQARRGEYYVAEEGRPGVRVLPAAIVREDYVRGGFRLTGDVELLGPGADQRAVEPPVRRCAAGTVGLLGERLILHGRRDDVRTLEPQYTLEFLLKPDLTERT